MDTKGIMRLLALPGLYTDENYVLFPESSSHSSVGAALAGLDLQRSSLHSHRRATARAPAPRRSCLRREPHLVALPLPEDRGEATLEQTLKRLGTTASVMMIVAHPDDEDGALLTYLSRGLGVRATLFTLTRGEGGQNAMSGDSDDALGLIRTNELLKADEYYGAKQLWGTEVDFGFSKTQEESFAASGATTAFSTTPCSPSAASARRSSSPPLSAASPTATASTRSPAKSRRRSSRPPATRRSFPSSSSRSKDGLGLQPWQPLAVYSMTPFAPVTDKGMFDYATGKWAPAKFKNYVTGEWITGVPSTDVTHSRRHSGSHSGPQLRADCARRLGRAEVAERRRQSQP